MLSEEATVLMKEILTFGLIALITFIIGFIPNSGGNNGFDSSSGILSTDSLNIVNLTNTGTEANTYVDGENNVSYSAHSSIYSNTNIINIGRSLDYTDTTTSNSLMDK